MHLTKTTDKLKIDKLQTMTVIDWIVGHGSLFDRTSTPEKDQVVAKLITPTEAKEVNRNPQGFQHFEYESKSVIART